MTEHEHDHEHEHAEHERHHHAMSWQDALDELRSRDLEGWLRRR